MASPPSFRFADETRRQPSRSGIRPSRRGSGGASSKAAGDDEGPPSTDVATPGLAAVSAAWFGPGRRRDEARWRHDTSARKTSPRETNRSDPELRPDFRIRVAHAENREIAGFGVAVDPGGPLGSTGRGTGRMTGGPGDRGERHRQISASEKRHPVAPPVD